MSPAHRKPAKLHVLYEDNHLLVLNKPAMLPTMGTPGGTDTLLTLAKQYVKDKYHKPGNVYLGVVSRLDAPVTGVVLFARTSKAARRLTEQFREGLVEKAYWALVEGTVESGVEECVDWGLRCWKSSCSPGVNTRSASNFPIAGSRSWAIGSTPAGLRFPPASRCTPGG
jgi:23S rRNA-/tRNA-specific pseudouridylate synthase